MSVVVFGAEKGGVGKTSLALNFTVMAAANGVDAVLLDTDRQQTASNWLAMRTSEEALAPISVLSNSADPLREVASLSKRYALVVVDIGAQNYRALLECALLADMYLVPTGTSAMDLDSTEEVFELLRKVGPRHRKRRIPAYAVLSKVPTHPNSLAVHRTRERLSGADVPCFDAQLGLRSAWRSMANTGRALTELSGRTFSEAAANEMQAVYQEIETRVAG